MGGRNTGWRGGRKADGRVPAWPGGQVCNGEVRSRRAAMTSKAALSLVSNLYSTLHGRYFQCIIGEKLSA